jgi:D-alanine transaminase/branched-chain amino acid aminotransferase
MVKHDADDVLYHNNGFIGECPRANFFIVTKDEVITAKDNILWGIIRSKVLNLNIPNYRIVARNFTLDELATAKEAFITSSTKNAYPVVSVDNKPVGNGRPGPVTSQINKALEQLMFAEASL